MSLTVAPKGGVRLGSALTVAGRATEAGAPLGGRAVALEARRYPYRGAWRRAGTATTRADGRFAFSPELNRNHRLRARLLSPPPDDGDTPPLPGAVSAVRTAYVLPAFTLSFTQRARRTIRLRQTYTVPRDVRLTAPTGFYVGAPRATRARLRARAATRRVRAGRYVARATVRIPRSFGGRFRYVSCFAYYRLPQIRSRGDGGVAIRTANPGGDGRGGDHPERDRGG